MSICTLRILCLLCLLEATIQAGRVVQESPPLQLRIWVCRQRCYRQTLQLPVATLPQCRAHPDCFMCHDYCRVLVVADSRLAKAMCADRSFCSRGCHTACRYHQL